MKPLLKLSYWELPELTLDSPKYTEAQNQLAKAEGAIKTEKGWWELPSGKLLVPEELAHTLVSQTHQATHLGHDNLEEYGSWLIQYMDDLLLAAETKENRWEGTKALL